MEINPFALDAEDGVISEILEQESLEVDSPRHHPRIIVDPGSKSCIDSNKSSSLRMPESFIKEDVNPVKQPSNLSCAKSIDREKNKKVNLKNSDKDKEVEARV